MSLTLSWTRKLLATGAVSALVGAAVIASPGTSQAATVYKFRLSQFADLVAEVCVQTDSDRICGGKWPVGRSEIFDVRANSLDGWVCWAEIVGGPTVDIRFSRVDAKECYLDGNLGGYEIHTKS